MTRRTLYIITSSRKESELKFMKTSLACHRSSASSRAPARAAGIGAMGHASGLVRLFGLFSKAVTRGPLEELPILLSMMAGEEKRGATVGEESYFPLERKCSRFLWKIHYNPACGHEKIVSTSNRHTHSACHTSDMQCFSRRAFEKLDRKRWEIEQERDD